MARPDRPAGRDAGRRTPDRDPPPHDNSTTRQSAEVVSILGRRTCWRCGKPLDDGTPETLALCTRLAQGAVEERTAGLCAACAAA